MSPDFTFDLPSGETAHVRFHHPGNSASGPGRPIYHIYAHAAGKEIVLPLNHAPSRESAISFVTTWYNLVK